VCFSCCACSFVFFSAILQINREERHLCIGFFTILTVLKNLVFFKTFFVVSVLPLTVDDCRLMLRWQSSKS